jgi:hypothetical protein
MDELHQRSRLPPTRPPAPALTRAADPSKGPQIPGWKQYSPADPGSLAILGLSESSAQAGNHTAADAACAYWNTLLPQYPQVRVLSAFVFARPC